MLAKLCLSQNLRSLGYRSPLKFLPLAFSFSHIPLNSLMINNMGSVYLPHRYLDIHRMVLHEGMVTHELHRSIPTAWMILSRKPFPYSYGWH
jgi:hypothetical protein